MPFVLDQNGMQIQTLAEIKADFEALYRGAFGDNIDLSAPSVFGICIGIAAEREAKVQNEAQAVWDSFDPDTATGLSLDARAALTATERKGATHSTAEALFVGTPGTVIDNGKQVKLIQTGSLWEVIDGPYILDGLGEAIGLVQAVETGPISALTTGPSGWQIISNVIGWDTFQNTADANLGSDAESDEVMRFRRRTELYKEGNDLAAMVASASAVEGVTFVKGFENATDEIDDEGRSKRSAEILVEGGDDIDIAYAILKAKPPGTETYGLEPPVLVQVGENNQQFIYFSRPQNIDVWLRATITTTGAEVPLPPNALVTIHDNLLAYANANHTMGDDVIPDYFTGTVYASVGNKSILNVMIETSLDGVTFTENVLPMGDRERADFDSAKIEVVEV